MLLLPMKAHLWSEEPRIHQRYPHTLQYQHSEPDNDRCAQLRGCYRNEKVWTVLKGSQTPDPNFSFFQVFFLDFDSTISCDWRFSSSRVMTSLSSLSWSLSGGGKQMDRKACISVYVHALLTHHLSSGARAALFECCTPAASPQF